jgi:hypothetical protein
VEAREAPGVSDPITTITPKTLQARAADRMVETLRILSVLKVAMATMPDAVLRDADRRLRRGLTRTQPLDHHRPATVRIRLAPTEGELQTCHLPSHEHSRA